VSCGLDALDIANERDDKMTQVARRLEANPLGFDLSTSMQREGEGISLAAKPQRERELFFEAPDCPALARRALGEGVATAGLTIAVVFAATATSLGQLRPLALGLGVPAAVAALTLAFGPATGAHFNPLITASQWLRGHRNTRCFIAYVGAQHGGALIGAGLVGLLVAPGASVTSEPIGLVFGSEIFASAGLVTIVLAASLVMSAQIGLLAVIGWLVMVNLAAPAGPFANPVLAIAAPFALGSLNIPIALVRIAAELVGVSLALQVVALTYPRTDARRSIERASIQHEGT
jgi:glycerol uptake facilitator-like aquaporin